MPEVELPRKSFTPCPKGPTEGTIVACDVEYAVPTQFGAKNRITLRIMSDKRLTDDDGIEVSGEDGTPYYFNLWDRFNIAGGPRATMTKRRTQILGRELSPEEANGFTCDTDKEFLGVRVGMVIVHNPNKNDPSANPYANIDTIYRLESQDIPPHAQAYLAEQGVTTNTGGTMEKGSGDTSALIESIAELEVKLAWTKDQVGQARDKYLGDLGILRASSDELDAYKMILTARLPDEDDLPF